ncbi:hypothetical protein N0V86_002312 [Didymella sp. IMI 355093]|nr:hypothetical protein N0V86_002312 [Didymella sp. IMI 355093]
MAVHYASSDANGVDSDNEEAPPKGQPQDAELDNFVKPALPRAMTGLDTTPVIERFLRDEFHHEHWDACAKRAQRLIQKKLKGLRDTNDEEIQAIVTSRAKTEKSLEEKLKMRNLERFLKGEDEYGSGADILDDVKDLAGVRVVLYTPNKAQRDKIKDIVKEIWGSDVEEKPHGERVSEAAAKANEEEGEYVRRHLGYQAEHYRCRMKDSQSKEHQIPPYKRKPGDMVEVQVVSALGHAWAEAGHDVLYKTHAYGRPPTEERRILDALNGLIISGDLLLEQFRESVTRRTVAKWTQIEPFVMFLRETDVLEKKVDLDGNGAPDRYCDDFSSKGKDILYRFLLRVQKNFPLAVRNALRDLGYPQNPSAGLEAELRTYEPSITPERGLLTPFCVMSKMMREVKPDVWRRNDYTISKKCSLMMDALILLQTFAGTPTDARQFLLGLDLTTGEYGERGSLDFVLKSPHRRSCFGGPYATPPDEWIDREMQPAWDWFMQQSSRPSSVCGLFFRLANMDVPAKVVDAHQRLDILNISCLSRSTTMENTCPPLAQ